MEGRDQLSEASRNLHATLRALTVHDGWWCDVSANRALDGFAGRYPPCVKCCLPEVYLPAAGGPPRADFWTDILG